MNNDLMTLSLQSIRGTDSNSLLRLYDRATEMFYCSPSQTARLRAGKAIERITKELQRRQIVP